MFSTKKQQKSYKTIYERFRKTIPKCKKKLTNAKLLKIYIKRNN